MRPGTLTHWRCRWSRPACPPACWQRRPDVAAAEAQLVAANFNIKAARAAFFPPVQLTGLGRLRQAPALSTLFGPAARSSSLAAGLTQPMFDGGLLRGQLEQAKGRYEELLADYRKAVVQAFTDVENALTAWRYATEQEVLQRQAVAAARTPPISRGRRCWPAPSTSPRCCRRRPRCSPTKTCSPRCGWRAFQALLSLYKALGGGWVEPSGPIEDQFPGLKPGLVPGGLALPVEATSGDASRLAMDS